MPTLGGTYSTGTVAVTNASDTVPGTGVLWSDVVEGDWLVAGGAVGVVDSVSEAFDEITLKTPWTGANTAIGPTALTSISNGASALLTAPAAHGLFDGDKITLSTSGGLPTGLAVATPYFVIAVSATTFRLSATLGGAAITTSSAGSGTHSFTRTASAYLILKMSWLRYDPSLMQAKVRALLAQLEAIGSFVFVDTAPPDPELGENGQFALKVDGSPWRAWLKVDDVWVEQSSPSTAGPGYAATSTTSFAVATGSKAFTTQAGLAYSIGARARASSAADGANYMEGLVTGYSSTTLTINVTVVGGSGTHTDWNLNLAGDAGSTGPAGAGYAATSTTSLAIGTGSRAFTTQAGLAYTVGARARAVSASGVTNWMEGLVTAYSGTTLTINVDKTNGSGTKTDWNINLTGEPGSGDLTAANNLSDVANAVTARSNLYAAPFDALAYNGMQLNGSAEVSQENGTTAVALATGTAAYVVDGWVGQFARTATLAISCQQVTPPGSPSFQSAFPSALQIKATTGLSPALAAGDYGLLEHRIEGYRVARLGFGGANAQSVTIGFWVYATIAGTMTISLSNSASNRSIPVNVVINNATTWEYKTVTIAGDTTGTWLNTSGVGLRIRFCFGSGSTFHGTNNTWAASGVFATSSTTNFYASTNNLACVTGVVVLPGIEAPVAARSPFIMKPYDSELLLAKRYWEHFKEAVNTVVFIAAGGAISTTQAALIYQYQVEKRTNPTFSVANVTSLTINNAGANNALTALAANGTAGLSAHGLLATVASGLINNAAAFLYNANTSAELKFDARL